MLCSDWIIGLEDSSGASKISEDNAEGENRENRSLGIHSVGTCVLATLRGIVWFTVRVGTNEMRAKHVFSTNFT